MYEPKGSRPIHESHCSESAGVVRWLKSRDAVEQVLQSSLGGPPSERDLTLARMGDVLQATARGLGPQAAAVWAGVPEHALLTWTAQDPAFAAALQAAAALASAHGMRPGKQDTPAMVRVLLTAMGNGASKYDAVKVAGFPHRRFGELVKSRATLRALLEAARRARPAKTRGAYIPDGHRPRRPGVKPPAPTVFRLVRRGVPEHPGGEADV